jgi:hypothetical protein
MFLLGVDTFEMALGVSTPVFEEVFLIVVGGVLKYFGLADTTVWLFVCVDCGEVFVYVLI